jgi:hypothetical protein
MPAARRSHHGARLPQRAAPVTPRAHPVRTRRTSLLSTWKGAGRHAGPAAAGDCARALGLRHVRQALVHAWLPPQLQVHTHSARSIAL